MLGQTIIQFPVADAKTPAEGLARTEAFLKEFANDELIVPALAPHAMYTLDAATLKAVRAMADQYKAPVIIHLAETADESKTSQKRAQDVPDALSGIDRLLGTADARRACGVAGRADIQILASRKVGVSHNPESNMKLASGTAKVPALQTAAITVGLGTDGAASNNDLDMFEAMRQAAFLHKHATKRSSHTAGEGRPGDGHDRRRARTRDGGTVSARSRQASAPTSSWSRWRAHDRRRCTIPLSHLVYVAREEMMSRRTIVNGKVLMRDRKVLTLNEADVISEANEIAEARCGRR